MNEPSKTYSVINDTFYMSQTIKIFTIQNSEMNIIKLSKKSFFSRIVLNIHCYSLLRLTKPGYEYSNTCLARHYLKYSITAQHVESSVQYYEEQRVGYDSKSSHLLLEVNTTNYEYV